MRKMLAGSMIYKSTSHLHKPSRHCFRPSSCAISLREASNLGQVTGGGRVWRSPSKKGVATG